MKKLIMLLAVVGISCLASAASFRWSNAAGGLTTPGGKTNDASLNELTVYLIDASKQESIEAAINDGTFSSSTAGVLGSTTTTSTKGLIAKTVVDADGYTVGKTYSVAQLVFMTDADNNQVYRISGAVDHLAWDSDTDVGAFANFVSTKWAAGTAGWETAGGDTPEPTSALLLLMGGAMLALRRKQK